MNENIKGKIVILGWGSLIWDPRSDFNKTIDFWNDDGPVLPIEFSRISKSRNGALTLVIDPVNGSQVKTKFAISKRNNPEDAVHDLCKREGTVKRNIGLVDIKNNINRGRIPLILNQIIIWLNSKGFQAVIWTDLPSNYEAITNNKFNPNNAIEYLKNLNQEGQKSAKTYIRKAPVEIQTPLRNKVMRDKWV